MGVEADDVALGLVKLLVGVEGDLRAGVVVGVQLFTAQEPVEQLYEPLPVRRVRQAGGRSSTTRDSMIMWPT